MSLGLNSLGADFVSQDGIIGHREPLKDAARNIGQWTDAIVARTYKQETIDELARWSPRSSVFDQAANRLHVQKALLSTLLQ